jgi:REP element-mobilizing transposase RayT
MRWRHMVISTVNSWLPGDPRGFRSRDHDVHSSGDYKNPPPPGEHEGLYNYSREISSDPVVIPRDLRPTVGQAILRKLKKLDHRVLALAVAGMHVHMLVELPDSRSLIGHIIGQCKTVSSHAIRDRLPGRVWGAGGGFKPVDDEKHHRNVYLYILRQPDAWVWSFKDEEGANPKPRGESSSPGGRDNPP